MIELYAVTGNGTDSERYDRHRWGILEDGEIVADNTEALPDEVSLPTASLQEYVEMMFDEVMRPDDPIATLQEHRTPPVVAAVPSEDGQTKYSAGDYITLVEDGDLTERELEEIRRYSGLGSAAVSGTEPAKAYRHSDIFSHVLLYHKSGQGNYTQIGLYHPDTEQVVADPTGIVTDQIERFDDQPGVRVDNLPSIILAPSCRTRCYAFDPVRNIATRSLAVMQRPGEAERDMFGQPSLRDDIKQALQKQSGTAV
jgi:hypothetical protein